MPSWTPRARRLLGHDPSISLHDDWQTTSLIASGYSDYKKYPGVQPRDGTPPRPVWLYEVNVPKVESIGWTLQEVAVQRGAVLEGWDGEHDPWFNFDGVWFDGRLQRTERYGLYGIPFLSRRLTRLLRFDTHAALHAAVEPYRLQQQVAHTADH